MGEPSHAEKPSKSGSLHPVEKINSLLGLEIDDQELSVTKEKLTRKNYFTSKMF